MPPSKRGAQAAAMRGEKLLLSRPKYGRPSFAAPPSWVSIRPQSAVGRPASLISFRQSNHAPKLPLRLGFTGTGMTSLPLVSHGGVAFVYRSPRVRVRDG